MFAKCKCEKLHCLAHRAPEDHECSFDFKMENKKYLEGTVVAVIKPKVIHF